MVRVGGIIGSDVVRERQSLIFVVALVSRENLGSCVR